MTKKQEAAPEGASDGTDTPNDPVVPPPPPSETVSMTSDALKTRLAEERAKGVNKLLKELGVDKAEDIKAMMKVKAELEAAQLSEKEKLVKELEDARKGASKASDLEKLAQELFGETWESLPEKVRESIEEQAGDSFQERARLVKIMKKAGLLGSNEAPKPPGKKAPANHGDAPPPPSPVPTKTAWEKYTEMKRESPMRASIFFDANRVEIAATQPPDNQ